MEENKKTGFTLIESFVTIAIIALLLIIIIPIIHPGPCGSPTIACAANMRNLTLGILVYKQDNRIWPDYKNWCDLLKLYIGEDGQKVYTCPIDKTGPCSYAMNEKIPADANELSGDLVVLFEIAPGWNQIGGADDVVTDRHGKPGANVAFADGHVEFVKAEDIPHLHRMVEQIASTP